MTENITNRPRIFVPNQPNPLQVFQEGSLPLDILLTIFKDVSFQSCQALREVSKSWNFVCLHSMNRLLDIYRAFVFCLNEKAFQKWSSLEKNQGKPANWIEIYKNEKNVDQKLLSRELEEFPQIFYSSPLCLDDQIFLCGSYLTVCAPIDPALSKEKCCIALFSVKTRNMMISVDSISISSAKKITENSFVTIEDNHVKLFQLEKSNRELVVRKETIKNSQDILFFNEKTAVNYSQDQSLLTLDIYDFESSSATQKQFSTSVLDGTEAEILKMTEDYLIVGSLNTDDTIIFFRKEERPPIEENHEFLQIRGHMALFHDTFENKVLEIDLSSPEPVFVPLFELVKSPAYVLATYMTENFYYIAGEKLHIYSKKSGEMWTFDFFQTGEKVEKCQFIRVTSQLIMLSLRVKDKHDRSYEQTVIYKLSEIFESGELVDHSKFPKASAFYFNENLVAYISLNPSMSNLYLSFFLHAYEFGKSPSVSETLINSIDLEFEK